MRVTDTHTVISCYLITIAISGASRFSEVYRDMMASVRPFFRLDEDIEDSEEDCGWEAEDFSFTEGRQRYECPKMRWKMSDIDPVAKRRPRKTKYSRFLPRYLDYREAGFGERVRQDSLFGLFRLLRTKELREKTFPVEPLDKIFCSEWLNARLVVFGTKCNRLMILDTKMKKLLELENLRSTAATNPPLDDLCGIHGIAVNPSRTRLATGASNPNDTAVFELPSLQPMCVGESTHEDWIFDVKWLDDEHYVSGGRDTRIALWQAHGSRRKEYIDRGYVRGLRNETLPMYFHMNAKTCVSSHGNKVRALAVDHQHDALLSLSLTARVQVWDTPTFKLTHEHILENETENVCIASHDRMRVTAIGSKSHVTLLDSGNLNPIRSIHAIKNNCGVRSVSFRDHLLTIGTGQSNVLFVDMRTQRYIEVDAPFVNATIEPVSLRNKSYLQCSPGWMTPTDQNFIDDFNPAVYTHCYDPTGLQLFTAGGPLPASLKGGYAALWR
ncbi:DDB1- and CUL4-associated factor 12-like isoform X2 [Varroa jacobsoni]|uniref:DDB1- and CUL4-associated factor 12-like isoform X2 n=2 Tax=Varroa jacobsoni TaxID=62625 RepID=UPI000BF80D14|nr:DDB1- and CUL4-associated factor 12-like isoform X2 [Varroa jacobsoni]